MSSPLKVCICGGGRDAHVLATLAASQPDTTVTVLAMFEDEATRWNKALENNEMTVTFKKEEGSDYIVKGKPETVSKKAEEVVPESDLLILACPAFSHEEYLKPSIQHIHPKTTIVGFPGQPGFEFQCRELLGDEASKYTVISFETSPWACSITEYGQAVEVQGTKKGLIGSVLRGKANPRKPAMMSLQMILGFEPQLKLAKHFLEVLLISYSFVTPAIMYGQWKDWDGNALSEAPLFYENVSSDAVELIDCCSKENLEVTAAIMAQKPNIDLNGVQEIYNWYLSYYKDDIEDGRSLMSSLKTNKFYKGIVHPMIKEKRAKYIPDFKNHYMRQDIACGLAVFRGLAEIVGVHTPITDMLLEWGQSKLEKEYLVEGKMNGKDIGETRCPQRYELTSLDDIINGKQVENAL